MNDSNFDLGDSLDRQGGYTPEIGSSSRNQEEQRLIDELNEVKSATE